MNSLNGTQGIRLTWAAVGIIVGLFINLVAVAVGYGRLNTTVTMGFQSSNERITALQQEVRSVSDRQRVTELDVARLEAQRARRANQ